MLDYQKRTKNNIRCWIRDSQSKISYALKLPMVIKQTYVRYFKHINNVMT